jgi:hypothetical protein
VASPTSDDASAEGTVSEDGDLTEALDALVGARVSEPEGDSAAGDEAEDDAGGESEDDAEGGQEEPDGASPAESDDLMDALSRLVGEGADSSEAAPATRAPDIEAPHEAAVVRPVSVNVDVVHRDPEDEDFAPFESESVAGSPDDLETAATDAAAAARVRTVVNAIVVVEGPVAVDRLAVLVARQFGLARVRKERMEQVVRLIPAAQQRPSDFGRFVWPASRNPETWHGFRRTPEDCDRSVDAIPPEEIRNAMIYFATRGMSISEESVLEELCDVFRIGRMSAAIRTRLLGVLAWALQRGDLRRDGDRIVPR